MVEMFVDPDYESEFVPIPIFDGVTPSNAVRFLIHVVLSMGHFGETEREVFMSTSWVEVFTKAGLVSDSGFGRGVGRQTVSSEDVDAILKRYIVEQLLFIPASTKSFDRYLVMARDILDNALIRNRLSSCDTPSCCR